eukprot:TRINITY_DN63647_c0_g1_i1.p1 TRINITY_DN63647_c0_g1~~TRINITY_DN63647_c0_g1_i1.p1  ORF type:complete len:139 (-),score=12.85 TRINITY_DN63647_c0_g1_i1:262-678(-)
MLVFLAAKLSRLVARTTFLFGECVDVQMLTERYGGREQLEAKLQNYIGKHNIAKEVRFSAREWYYHPNNNEWSCTGRSLFVMGFFFFGLEAFAVVVLVFIRLADVLENGFPYVAFVTLAPLFVTIVSLIATRAIFDLG